MFDLKKHYADSIAATKIQEKRSFLKKYDSSTTTYTKNSDFVLTVASTFYGYISEDRNKFQHKLKGVFPFLKSDKIETFQLPSIKNASLQTFLSEEIKKSFKTKTGEKKMQQFIAAMQLLDKVQDFSSAFEFAEKFEELTKKIEKEEDKDLAKRMRETLICTKAIIDFEKVKAGLDEKLKKTEEIYKANFNKVCDDLNQLWPGLWKILSDDYTRRQLNEMILKNKTDSKELNVYEKKLNDVLRMMKKSTMELAKTNKEIATFLHPKSLSREEDLKTKSYSLEQTLTKTDIEFLKFILEKIDNGLLPSPQEVINVLKILDEKSYNELIAKFNEIFPIPVPVIQSKAPAVAFS